MLWQADQGNRTSLPITRCWLYPWATVTHKLATHTHLKAVQQKLEHSQCSQAMRVHVFSKLKHSTARIRRKTHLWLKVTLSKVGNWLNPHQFGLRFRCVIAKQIKLVFFSPSSLEDIHYIWQSSFCSHNTWKQTLMVHQSPSNSDELSSSTSVFSLLVYYLAFDQIHLRLQ